MKTVSRHDIEETWKRLGDLDSGETTSLAKKFFEAQPALGIFLAVAMEELAAEADTSPMLDLAVAAWQAMTQHAGGALPPIPPEDIEAFEEANAKQLEALDEGSELDWMKNVQELVSNYNQREILGFGIEVLMSRYEEAPDLAPDSLGLEMLNFKTVIDCLDK